MSISDFLSGWLGDLTPAWMGQMGFFHFSDFEEKLLHYHTLYITGELGSGKTLLAFALGHYCIQQRYVEGIWTNVPHTFPVSRDITNSFVVFDEAGIAIDSRLSSSTYSMYGAFARKSNTIYTFPSVIAVDKRCRNLEVLRIADIELLPFRIWIYSWYCTNGARGWFGLSYPETMFNTYDTKAVPFDDGGILEAFCAKYPEAIEFMLENKYGDRLKQIMGWSRKGGRREISKGELVSGGAESSDNDAGGLSLRASLAGLVGRVDSLEQELEALNVEVKRIVGTGEEKASGYQFRN